MAINVFDVATTRRLSIGLMGAAGALLFSALNLVGVGISVGDRDYATNISQSVTPLAIGATIGLVTLILAEIAAHPNTPPKGRLHGKDNYLQSAFALLAVVGLGHLLYGGYKLISAATVLQ
jgi:hypothetical protein